MWKWNLLYFSLCPLFLVLALDPALESAYVSTLIHQVIYLFSLAMF